MTRRAIVAGVALALLGCRAEPISSERTGALDSVRLDTLFQAHGCTMYRFFDGGNAHYWATCPGTVSSERTESRADGAGSKRRSHTEVESIQTVPAVPKP